MRLILKLFVFLCLFPVSLFCQEQITQFKVGPYNDQIRIIAAFIQPSQESYKMQSMIIDMNRIRNNQEQPESVSVDLTSTIRNLSNGEKNQKILQFRWNKKGEIEMRCSGKFTKQGASPAITKIIDTVKSIFQIIPLNPKEATDFTATPELRQNILSVFDFMTPETFSCLRVQN